jgi:hypothetical protein
MYSPMLEYILFLHCIFSNIYQNNVLSTGPSVRSPAKIVVSNTVGSINVCPL